MGERMITLSVIPHPDSAYKHAEYTLMSMQQLAKILRDRCSYVSLTDSEINNTEDDDAGLREIPLEAARVAIENAFHKARALLLSDRAAVTEVIEALRKIGVQFCE